MTTWGDRVGVFATNPTLVETIMAGVFNLPWPLWFKWFKMRAQVPFRPWVSECLVPRSRVADVLQRSG